MDKACACGFVSSQWSGSPFTSEDEELMLIKSMYNYIELLYNCYYTDPKDQLKYFYN